MVDKTKTETETETLIHHDCLYLPHHSSSVSYYIIINRDWNDAWVAAICGITAGMFLLYLFLILFQN
jgi:hypothetical protein